MASLLHRNQNGFGSILHSISTVSSTLSGCFCVSGDPSNYECGNQVLWENERLAVWVSLRIIEIQRHQEVKRNQAPMLGLKSSISVSSDKQDIESFLSKKGRTIP